MWLFRRTRIIIAVLIVVLITSIALNVMLFSRAKQYYTDLNAVRLDPLGLSNYQSRTEPSVSFGQITVAFLGDSRAARWPTPTTADRFEFINRGIDGQTSAQVLLRFDYHLTPVHPNIVVLQVGINDLKTIPLFPEQKTAIIANCKDNIKRMIDKSTALGAIVIVSTIFPVGNPPLERQPFWSADISVAINEVNQYLRTLSGTTVIVLDADPILMDGKLLRSQYAVDELHINSEGYAALNSELVRILDRFK